MPRALQTSVLVGGFFPKLRVWPFIGKDLLVLFIQDQAQRLTEWLQLSGFENPVSESTTLCPREREKWIPTCVAICVPSPGTVHAALRHPTTLSQRSSPEAEMEKLRPRN
ncbi:surfactant-associated protein 3 isoform X2 [Macaca fascicularis]|uniref:surfactant-associated protein 3 isoform X2 n=1 Tax=Macaca fascicularis TaxID=9541 RepID=UPI0032B07E83